MAALKYSCLLSLLFLLIHKVRAQAPVYSCPTGFIADAASLYVDTIGCEADPCYQNGICGAGNTCTDEYHEYAQSLFTVGQCSCSPPYVQGSVFQVAYFQKTCYQPGQDPCSTLSCLNGGTCTYFNNGGVPTRDAQGNILGAYCNCTRDFGGPRCQLSTPGGVHPVPTVTSSTPPSAGDQGVCGTGAAAAFPTRCWFNNDPQGRYVCCDSQGCAGFNADNLTPHCANFGYVPPNDGLSGPGSPPSNPPSAPPTGDQGVCGTGDAGTFPTRCWFNNDPQGRYVCCDSQGCNGFNTDNLTPHCANFGFVPPNFGLPGGSSTPPSTPSSGSQGVCGTGAASSFPTRCWFNSDPLGRYVCCDAQGCDGFNADNLTPHCANFGYVPPGYGLG